jgi:hypothetical protein
VIEMLGTPLVVVAPAAVVGAAAGAAAAVVAAGALVGAAAGGFVGAGCAADEHAAANVISASKADRKLKCLIEHTVAVRR